MTSNGIDVHTDGHIGWIRINRPERLNALADDMREHIDAGLEQLENDEAIRCVVITGAGRAFSTGGDVSVMAELADRGDEERFNELVR
ncbi:MAG TPA: enoyl-CoA hydratase/isomerase family protein, partial [Longimicrobiales bacterium]|nr:enoyl-CoA hydratase/isomerase family protein [Longimicrobiales bacterium]